MVRLVLILGIVFCSISLSAQSNEAVLEILDSKCNVCHTVEKPETIFTLENMEAQAKQINRQVFIFRLMPKGKEVVLSNEEKVILKDWIKKVKSKK